ncbi:hypothetical protein GGR55DRAFT_345632 [Xylaria sp. FL0064]|nr:hypothetical protein GGR55DRAFT_345632 [Xylaria sp. FL0064]
MAPSTRVRRQRRIVSSDPSVGATASDSAPPLSDGNNTSDNPELKGADRRPDMFWSPQEQEQLYVDVLGERIPVPRIYDPDCYDPERPVPWTPEPEPYDPETYAAWGRKRFGEEWFKRRTVMLQERNFYLDPPDPVYKQRQRALRILESKVEGRPMFKWAIRGWKRAAEREDSEEWKRLWARLSKDLPPDPPSPPRNENDDDTDLSGYNTYAPTPDSSYEPPPPTWPEDPWERLEEQRKTFRWDEEMYQYEKILLIDRLITRKRGRYEDEPGDRQRQEELDEIKRIRTTPLEPEDNLWRRSREYTLRIDRFNRLAKGATEEQVDAEDREREEEARKRREEEEQEQERKRLRTHEETMYETWDGKGISREEQRWLARMHGFQGQRPPTPPPRGFTKPRRTKFEKRQPPRNQEEMDKLRILHLDFWGGLTRQEQNEVAHMYGFRGVGEEGHDESWKPGPSRSPPAEDITRDKTRGGRITKNTRRRQSGTRSDNTQPDAPPQHRRRQRKTYEKERASRRIAGQLPEFGLLPERGGAVPLYEADVQHSLNTTKTSTVSARSGRPSKRQAAVKAAKPGGVSKSPRTRRIERQADFTDLRGLGRSRLR